MDPLFTILWKMSVVVGLFYFFYKIFLEKETYFKLVRYYFIAGCLLSVIIPFIIVPIYQIQEPAVATFTFLSNNSLVAHSNPASLSFDWIGFFTYIYFIGTAFFLLRFIIQILSIFNLILKSGLKKVAGVYIVKTDKDSSPFSFFNFIVYNSSHFKPNEIELIIAHEKVHARQRHSVDSVLINLLMAVQWFNPIIWFYKKELEQNLEFIADENAVKKSNNKKSYQQLLLKSTMPNYQMALANNFYNSLLKKRIMMLHKQRSNSNKQWKFALMAPLLLAFIFTFNTKVIAQDKKEVKKMEKKVEVYAMGFSKATTQDKLDKLVKDFAEKGVDVKFSGIKRNKENHITAIEVKAEAKSGKTAASYGADDDKGINPITISFDNENNNLSIGSGKEHGMNRFAFRTKGSKGKMKQKGKGKRHIIKSTSDTEDDDVNIWINEDGDTTKVIKKEIRMEMDSDGDDEDMEETIIEEIDESGKKTIKKTIKKKGKGKHIMISEDDDDPNTVTTYIVNGKKMSKEEFKKMDKDKIKTIEIKKEVKKKE